MEKTEYLAFIERNHPRASVKKTLPYSFLFGGIISAIGEVFRLIFVNFSINEKDAGALVSLILIFITAILTGFGVFHKIAKVAGAGTFVPITGFANSIISSALEFKTEGFVLGVGAKMFVIAGPVIVFGTIASIVCGIIYYLIEIFGGAI